MTTFASVSWLPFSFLLLCDLCPIDSVSMDERMIENVVHNSSISSEEDFEMIKLKEACRTAPEVIVPAARVFYNVKNLFIGDLFHVPSKRRDENYSYAKPYSELGEVIQAVPHLLLPVITKAYVIVKRFTPAINRAIFEDQQRNGFQSKDDFTGSYNSAELSEYLETFLDVLQPACRTIGLLYELFPSVLFPRFVYYDPVARAHVDNVNRTNYKKHWKASRSFAQMSEISGTLPDVLIPLFVKLKRVVDRLIAAALAAIFAEQDEQLRFSNYYKV